MAEVRMTVKELEVSTDAEKDTILAVGNADGNYALLKGANLIAIENSSATIATTVTFKMVGVSNTGNTDDVDAVVAAGKTHYFNPSEHWRYADKVGNDIHWTYDSASAAAISDVKVGVIRIPMSAI